MLSVTNRKMFSFQDYGEESQALDIIRDYLKNAK